jgi:hypothetical protein
MDRNPHPTFFFTQGNTRISDDVTVQPCQPFVSGLVYLGVSLPSPSEPEKHTNNAAKHTKQDLVQIEVKEFETRSLSQNMSCREPLCHDLELRLVDILGYLSGYLPSKFSRSATMVV